jgi:hypothetical protein
MKTISLDNYLLGDIEMALNDNNYEMEWYLDIQEEKTTFLADPLVVGEDMIDEELQKQIENDEEEGERYIAIPTTPSHDGWGQMKRFILSLDDQDDKIQNLLLTTIQGKGAFRRFKDAVYEIGVSDRWYDFKNREDRRKALEWLHSEDLIAEEDIETGMQMYEDRLKKRKQREKEIEAMTEGTQLKCIQNQSHKNKLTIGKIYKVREEQKQHKNVRVRDDRGKLVFMPKSYFELTNLRVVE